MLGNFSIWNEVTFLGGFTLVGLLPGLALLWAARVGWSRSERLAAAPGLSLGIISFCAYLAEFVGFPVTPWAVFVLLLALFGLVCWLSWRGGRAVPANNHGSTPESWSCWLVFLLPLAVVLMLGPFWGYFILPPTLDDGVHHATWFRLILDRMTLDPVSIYAFPVSENTPVYYPWGFHGWAAQVAHLTSLEPIDTYRRLVLITAGCIPLSVYAFAARLLPRGWPSVGAGFLTLFFGWLPFQPFLWGGYALMAGALCMLPLVRLSLDALEQRRSATLLLAATVGLGLLFIHPSQAMGALLITAVMALWGSWRGVISWRWTALLIILLSLVGLVFSAGSELWDPLRKWMVEVNEVSQNASLERVSIGYTLASELNVHVLDFFRDHNGELLLLPAVICLMLLLAGLVAAVRPLWRGLLLLHLALLLLFGVSLQCSWWTILWYHQPERIWYLQLATLPLLLSLGLWQAAGMTWLNRRIWRTSANERGEPAEVAKGVRRQGVIYGVLLLAVLLSSYQLLPNLTRRFDVAMKWMSSDPRHLQDFEWIRENIPQEEILLNSPDDFGLVYPFTGRRLTFPNCQVGGRPEHYIWALRALHDTGHYSRWRHQYIRAMGIRYVYVALWELDRLDATHYGWIADSRIIAGNPGLEPVYMSSTSRIYRLRDERVPAAAEVGFSLSGPPATFKGFYSVYKEKSGKRYRWTAGHGKVRIPREAVPLLPGCTLALGVWSKSPLTIRWDGTELNKTLPGVYPLDGVDHLLEIKSSTFVPQAVIPGSMDGRELGVFLDGITLSCSVVKGGPPEELKLPLGGSDTFTFGGFYDVEEFDGAPHCWTNGRGEVRIPQWTLPGHTACQVTILYNRQPDDPVSLLWDGVPLEQAAPGVYPLPSRGSHLLELINAPTRRKEDGKNFGASLKRLAIRCPMLGSR